MLMRSCFAEIDKAKDTLKVLDLDISDLGRAVADVKGVYQHPDKRDRRSL